VAGEGIELVDRLDLVAEEGKAPGAVFQVRRPELDRIAANAEGAAGEGGIVAAIIASCC
jgi:hypothetical protein